MHKPYELARNNSHWLVLAYSLAAARLTYMHSYFGELPDAFLFYFFLPVFIIIVLKGRLRDHGLSTGDLRQSIAWTAVFVALSLATTWLSVRYMPGIRDFYRGEVFGPAFVVTNVAYMIAWEFFFRGFMLFGLEKKFGFWGANCAQTFIFFLLHIGKPAPELYSTLLTGLLFGYLTYRCRSVIPMVIIHSSIMLSVVYFATS